MVRVIPIVLLGMFLGSGCLFATMLLTQDQTPYKRTGDKETYWGAVTSNVDWCERNGVHTYYIMEFWNTISSFTIALFGLFGYLTTLSRFDKRIPLSHFFMLLVGLGSVSFHATLQHNTQLLDEMPMLHGTLVFIYVVLQMDPKVNRDPWLKYALIFFGLCITGFMTLLTGPPAAFQMTYIAGVITLIVKSALFYKRCKNTKACLTFEIGLFCYISGSWCWAIERMYCQYVEQYQLHAWWHLLSGLGTYLSIVFWTYLHEEARGRDTFISNHPTYILPIAVRGHGHTE